MIHLDYRDARPIYTQIVDNVRKGIATGVLRHGDKLPSVRELAAELAINPNTIQRAYRVLEMQGCVASVPGKGCFVCGVPVASGQERELLETFDKTAAALLALGMALLITFQALLHIMVAVNLFPETGQNLPMISRGGTSQIMISLALGAILSVSRQTEDNSFDNNRFIL